ncbi:UNVERIFIED_CONTAM: hypothetical protein RMT77_005203 [Armadillidium vulgare]
MGLVHFAMDSKKNFITLATYICPSITVDFYEFLGSYIEAQVGIRTTLMYDSRRNGPDISKGDHKFIDLAFVSTTTYLEQFSAPNSEFKLLSVGGVSEHPVKGETLGYYTDIVLSRDTRERAKEFFDLRGCSFAYSHETSLSAAKQVLITLKQLGENASFFSNVKCTGNHFKAMEAVIAKKAECAAVGSIAFSQFIKKHYYLASELQLFESWGPLPPHPIIVNKNLPDNIVCAIEEAILRLHKTPGWNEQLLNFGFLRFEKTSPDTYLGAQEMLNSTKSLAIGVTYY